MLIYRIQLRTEDDGNTIATVNISKYYKLQVDCKKRVNQELKQYLRDVIHKYLVICEDRKIKLEPPEEIESDPNDDELEVLVAVDYTLKKGLFEKTFPVIGHISNVLAILSVGFVSYLAMRVTVGNNDNEARAFSFVGAIYTLLITFCIYVFSGASRGLAAMGRKIDGAFMKRPSSPLLQIDHNEESEDEFAGQEVEIISNDGIDSRSSARRIIQGLSAGALVMLNQGISGVTTYQQVSALGKTVNEEYLSYVITIIPFVLIISAGISNSAFQWGFIHDALDFLTQCCRRRCAPTIEEQSEQAPILTVDADQPLADYSLRPNYQTM